MIEYPGKKTGPEHFPAEATFELTYRCNLDCLHCYVPPSSRSGEELDTAGVKLVLERLKESGVVHLAFTGGEPFMREDVMEIIEYARELRFSVGIITNGISVTKEVARKLAELKITRVDQSIYGMSAETYERITGNPEGFELALRAFDYMLEAGLEVRARTLLLDMNVHETGDFVRFAEEKNIPLKFSPAVTSAWDGSEYPLKRRLSPDRVADLAEKGLIRIKRIKRKKGPICRAGFTNPVVSADGSLYPCTEFREKICNAIHDDAAAAWRDSEAVDRIRSLRWKDFPGCVDCRLTEWCAFCPAAYLREAQQGRRPFSCSYLETMSERGLLE